MKLDLTRQQGISFVGLMTLLVVVGFLTLLGLKLVPIYLENFKIAHALEGTIQEPGITQKTRQEIGGLLLRRLDIDSVKRINHRNWPKYVKIVKKQGKVSIDVNYRAETPLVANVGMFVDFEQHVEN